MKYRLGDIVTYVAGNGEVRRVRVEVKTNDILDGKRGFEGIEVRTNRLVWGYDEQITDVTRQ